MSTQKTPKAKRKLSNIDFSGKDAHLALVSKEQGAANRAEYALVLKSNASFTQEILEKAQRIRVEMDLVEFLEKFFYLYEDDAETLAKLLGWVDLDEIYEEDPSFELLNADFQDLISSNMESMDVMMSLHQADSIPEVLSKISGEEYLSLLKDQERVEKAFKKLQKNSSNEEQGSTEVNAEVGAEAEAVKKAVVKSGDFVTWGSSGGSAYGKVKSVKRTGSIKVNDNVSITAEADNPAVLIEVYKKDSSGNWTPSGTTVGHKANTLSKVQKSVMKKSSVTNSETTVNVKDDTKTMQTQTTEFEVEVVEKSAVEAIQKAAEETKIALEKALQEQKEELLKAKELLDALQKEKQEAIEKAKFQQVKDAVKDEAKAEVLFKAAKLLQDDSEFQAVVKALQEMTQLIEKSELFTETGVSVEGEGTQGKPESKVAQLLKAKYHNTK